MKKVLIILGLVLAVGATLLLVNFAPERAVANANTEYLRIHVRANSNSAEDQKVKYEVKDEAVKFITPYIKECVTKEAAAEVMQSILPQIEEVCTRALEERGYTYGARASVRTEKFPTRVYGELTLEEGAYEALIIELGTGTGDNWWCVIYPPLCFTSASADVEYRSIITDIINKWRGR